MSCFDSIFVRCPKCGEQIVFSTYPSLKDRPEIEIYDDYRE